MTNPYTTASAFRQALRARFRAEAARDVMACFGRSVVNGEFDVRAVPCPRPGTQFQGGPRPYAIRKARIM